MYRLLYPQIDQRITSGITLLTTYQTMPRQVHKTKQKSLVSAMTGLSHHTIVSVWYTIVIQQNAITLHRDKQSKVCSSSSDKYHQPIQSEFGLFINDLDELVEIVNIMKIVLSLHMAYDLSTYQCTSIFHSFTTVMNDVSFHQPGDHLAAREHLLIT